MARPESNVSVVLVTHNRPEDVKRCLHSLSRQTLVPETIVVDNCSDPPLNRGHNDSITVVRTDVFLGPADAKNLGIARVHGATTVLLDDDAELCDPDALERIVAAFTTNFRIACVALNCQGTWMGSRPVEQMARLPTNPIAINASVVINGTSVRRVAEFIGAGCAFRTSVFHSVGGFPTGYGYGYEEPHLAYRMMDAGWFLVYLRTVMVHHHHSVAWRLSDATRAVSQLQNKWALAAELLPLPWVPAALVGFTLRTLVEAFRRKALTCTAVWAGPQGFAKGWHRRRPIKSSTVKEILALRGRL